MRVGLNLLFLVPGETGGTEVVARELLPRLAGAGVPLTAFLSREAARTDGPWQDVASVTAPVAGASRTGMIAVEQALLPRLAARAGVEVLHSLANTGPSHGPFARVVTIHDLIHRTHPQTHAGLRARGLGLLVPLAARRSHRVLAVSRATADDLVRHLAVPLAKIDVVPNGAGAGIASERTAESELRARLDLGARRVALSLSAKRAHKNLEGLVDALALVPRDERPVLVVPGYPTEHERVLVERTRRLGVEDDVRFTGWVSAADLEGLYALAEAFVFPSFHEGFGLPVLEAMARGVPVACSGRGALAEVAGDAALAFDPHDPAAIATAIRRLLGEPLLAQRLSAAGHEQAGRFTWERNAELTLASYERALRSRDR